MFNKNVVVTILALSILGAPSAFAQGGTAAAVEAAKEVQEHTIEGKAKKAETDAVLNGEQSVDSVRSKVKAGKKQAEEIKDISAEVENGIRSGAVTDKANLDAMKALDAKSKSPVATVKAQDELAKLHNDLSTLMMKDSVKSSGLDTQFFKNIEVLGKWNKGNAAKIEGGVDLLFSLHGSEIAHLNADAKAEVAAMLKAILAKTYAMGYEADSQLSIDTMKDDVETYILNLPGSKSLVAVKNKAEFFRAAHNKRLIYDRMQSQIAREKSANGGRNLTPGREAEIKSEVVLQLIKEHHNINGGGQNDPTRMTETDMQKLRDQIISEKC